jgi:methylase of polypeptide subunit release factors
MIGTVDVRLQDGRKHQFRYRDDREWIVKSVLQGGRYSMPRTPAEDRVRRALDVGSGCGEFQVIAMLRWPRCWIDWVEEDEELAELCEGNAVPGARRIASQLPIDVRAYDAVRCTVNVASFVGAPRPVWIEDWQVFRGME